MITDIFAQHLAGGDDPETSFGVYMVADGYQSENDFILDCNKLLNKLAQISPFECYAGLFKQISPSISFWMCFNASPAGTSLLVDTGPYNSLPSSSIASSTPMGGYYNYTAYPQTNQSASRGEYSLRYTDVITVFENIKVYSPTQNANIPLVVAGQQYLEGIIIVLSPEVPLNYGVNAVYSGMNVEDTASVELEHYSTSTNDEFLHFYATSCNQGFEQLAARAIGLGLGLGDESERQSGMPDSLQQQALDLYANLVVASTHDDARLKAKQKWAGLTSQSIAEHFKSNPTSALPTYPSSPVANKDLAVSLWEGGGGFANGVYRPAYDCIMRYKIGGNVHYVDGTRLLIKRSEHSFCPVCRINIQQAIHGHFSTKHSADAVTLSTQKSEYNKIKWLRTDEYGDKISAANSYVIGLADAAFHYPQYDSPLDTEPDSERLAQSFWTFNCKVRNGFEFTNFVVRQSWYYDRQNEYQVTSSSTQDIRDVFSSISFKNIRALFSDVPGDDHSFDIDTYIAANKFTLKKSYRGGLGMDSLYQYGFVLTIIEDSPNMPHMEVQLSLVTRGPSADFDPGSVAVALKIYPQIQFKWSKRPGLAKEVKKFDGTVRIVGNPKCYEYDPPSPMCGTGSSSKFVPHQIYQDGATSIHRNDASCFADSNVSLIYGTQSASTRMARKDVEPVFFQWVEGGATYFSEALPSTKPTWASVFDSHYPNIVNSHQPVPVISNEFIGVYGPEAKGQAKVRKMYVRHQVERNPDVFNDIFIKKMPRQGAYDNLHITGYMGNHTAFTAQAAIQAQLLANYPSNPVITTGPPSQLFVADVANEPVVAAPFCGMDCLHLHWRWSILSEIIASTRISKTSPASFRGWSNKKSHSAMGASLIPYNQELRIRFEALSHAASATLRVGNNSTVEEEKVLEYAVQITAPAPDENQVILEQGLGWAMIYSQEVTVPAAEFSTLVMRKFPRTDPPIAPLRVIFQYKKTDHRKMFDYIYDYIRFHHTFSIALDDGGNAKSMKIHDFPQIPVGTELPTLLWPAGDALVDSFKAGDDAKFQVGDYDEGGQIIVDSGHSELNNVAIQDL